MAKPKPTKYALQKAMKEIESLCVTIQNLDENSTGVGDDVFDFASRIITVMINNGV